MALAWTQRVEGFPELQRQQCVVADGVLVVLGFELEESPFLECVLLDPRDCSWRYGPRLEGMYDTIFSVAAVRREVFVLFSEEDADELDFVQVLRMDTGTLEWTLVETSGDVPSGIAFMHPCVVDELLFLFVRSYWASEDVHEDGMDVGGPYIYSLDSTTLSWRFVSKEYPVFPDPHNNVLIGRCLYSIKYRDAGHRCMLSWRDFGTGQYGIQCLHERNTLSVGGGTLLGHRDHILFLGLGPEFNINGRNELRSEVNRPALRYDVDGQQWMALAPVYGEQPVCFFIACAAVVGDRAFVVLNPLFRMHTPTEGEVRVVDLAPGLRTLCLLAVRRHGLDASGLPSALQRELQLLPPSPPPPFVLDTSVAGMCTGGESALAIGKK